MLLPRLTSLLLVASTAHAFKSSSPFLLLSSDPLPKDSALQSAQVALTKDVEDRLIETLSECRWKSYYIWTQDGVSADDFRTAEGGMAKLRRKVEDVESEGGAVVQIPEVVVMGELSAEGIKRRLEEVCGAKGLKSVDSWPAAEDEYYIATTHRPTLPTNSEERATALSEADTILNDIFTIQPNPSILIYITTPPEDVQSPHPYEMDEPYPSALHVDLKRDLHQKHRRQADDDLNMQSGLGLFEKYQFFTPGLFMGLGVSLLLLMLLYVGIGAISGLEVSYAAFSKEMVQSAQKGKMQ